MTRQAPSIVGVEPSTATDIVILGSKLAGAYAHRRVMKDVKIGEKLIPAHRAGNIDFPARVEPILRYDQTAGCLGEKGTPMSWGWAQANGARLCPDCWEDGYGADYDGGPPAFQLESQPLAADGTIPDPTPTVAGPGADMGTVADAPPVVADPTDEDIRRAAVVEQEEPPSLWDPEWGPAEPPDDDYMPPADWEPPTTRRNPAGQAEWDYSGRGNYYNSRPVVKGPELP